MASLCNKGCVILNEILKENCYFLHFTVIIYTIAVLVLMFSTGCSEPTTLTENVFTYFGIEAFALALIKVADTVKEATDKFEHSKKKHKSEEKGDD